MPVFDEKQEELEHYETMMGVPRGRLAVTMDTITDAMALVGQHGVYCQSQRWPGKPVMDIQIIMKSLTDAKELIQSVMEELKNKGGSSVFRISKISERVVQTIYHEGHEGPRRLRLQTLRETWCPSWFTLLRFHRHHHHAVGRDRRREFSRELSQIFVLPQIAHCSADSWRDSQDPPSSR